MTSHTPHQRQQHIMRWLQEHQSLSIEELADRLGVSAMTVHRDLDQLVKSGLIQKVYGAAELVDPKAATPPAQPICAMCSADVPYRTAFTAKTAHDTHMHACCAHCGLLLMGQDSAIESALTRDFIYGRMVNVRQAVYVLESRVQLCCVPGVLCFTCADDAEAFQRGFGGHIMNFEQAISALARQHTHP